MSDKFQTARRIIIFVGITWLVILLTPKLFPTRNLPPSPDSAAVSVPMPASVTGQQTQTQPTLPGQAATQVALPPDSVPAIVQPAESLSINSALSRYTFTNKGATIVAAELPGYRTLGSGEGSIQLLRDSEALLQYAVHANGQTIPLRDVLFTPSASADPNHITYSADVPGTAARITFNYNVVPDSYVVRVNGRIEGASGNTLLLAQFPTGLRSGEADTTEDLRHYAIAYKPVGHDAEDIKFAKLQQGESRVVTRPLAWAAMKSKYFILGLLQKEDSTGFGELNVTGGPRAARTATHINAFVVDDITAGTFSFDIYAGPQEFTRLTAMGSDFNKSNPYGGILQPMVQPFAVIVMKVLLWLKNATSLNYGWVLVIFGVIVRLALWPLNQRAMRSSIQMQRLQPELQVVQEKYKGNPEKQREELMKVYASHGMTPFSPLAGCLPMLIPMPVLFALFFVFQNTIEFRGVSFLWLPDISQRDPFYIVPVFMGLSMYFMSWLGARGVQQNPQTKMMLYALPVMMTVLFLNFASGLNLYYAVQNIAALPQQWLIAREKAKAGVGTAPGANKPGNDKRRDRGKKRQ